MLYLIEKFIVSTKPYSFPVTRVRCYFSSSLGNVFSYVYSFETSFVALHLSNIGSL